MNTVKARVFALGGLLACVGLMAWFLAPEGGPARGPVAPPARTLGGARAGAADTPASAVPLASGLAPGEQPHEPVPIASPAGQRPAETPAETPPVRPGEAIALTGRIVDHLGQPIAGARVTFVPDEQTLAAWGYDETRSDRNSDRFDPTGLPFVLSADDGAFRLESTHSFDVDAIDYYPMPPEVDVQHPDFATRAFPCAALVQAGLLELGDIALEPGATLVGRVVDEVGAPLEGVDVRAPWSGVERQILTGDFHRGAMDSFFRATTDASGRFTLSGFWHGKVGPRFSAPGRLTVAFNKSNSVPVVAGETTDMGDVTLGWGGMLAGRVEDAAGRPVEGARVLAVSDHVFQPDAEQDALASQLRAEADLATHSLADGSFQLTGLRDERTGVLVHAPAFALWTGRRIDLDGRALRVTLERAAAWRLVVLADESGEPLPAAQLVAHRVRFADPERQWSHESCLMDVLTDAQASAAGFEAPAAGEFLLAPVGPFGVLLEVSAAGRGSFRGSLPGLAPGEQRTHTLRLPAARRITGSVRDESGAPIPAAAARVFATSETRHFAWTALASTVTDAAGAFELDSLGPEPLQLVAAAERAGFLESEPIEPQFDAQGLARVDVVLARGAVLHGHVYASDGQPAAGEQVHAFSDDFYGDGGDLMRRVRSGPTGEYTLAGLPAADYSISAGEGDGTTITLTPPDVVELDLHMRDLPRIRGRVTAGGLPVPSATVNLVGSFERDDGTRHEYFAGLSRTTPDGRFELEAYLGEHAVLVSSERGLAPRHELVLAWGDVVELELVLGNERLTGRVLDDATGAGVPGASITLTFDAAAPGVSPQRTSTKTDEHGAFAFEALIPGQYSGSCKAEGYFDVTLAPLDVQPGAVREPLELRLVAGARLHGTLTYDDGRTVDDGTEVLLSGLGGLEAKARGKSKSGTYEVEVEAAGSYRVEVRPRNWSVSASMGYEEEPVPPLGETTVTLEAGQDLALDLSVRADG